MTNDEIDRLVLARFSLKTAATKGGLSPAVIRGGPLKKLAAYDVDAALTRLRKDGTLAFSAGLWWKRRPTPT
jgi:hypothetical protein